MSVQFEFNYKAIEQVHHIHKNLIEHKDYVKPITQLKTGMPPYAHRIFYHLWKDKKDKGQEISGETAGEDAFFSESLATHIEKREAINHFLKELNIFLRPIVEASEEQIASDPQCVAVLLKKTAARAHEQQIHLKTTPRPSARFRSSMFLPTSAQIETRIGPYQAGVVLNLGAYVDPKGMPPKEMEDVALCKEFSIEQQGQPSQPCQLFAIFDGHRGRSAADFAQEHLIVHLKSELEKQSDLNDLSIYNAVTRAFIFLDRAFKETKSVAGSTAAVAFILNGSLWTANLGDSRIILATPKKTIQLTTDDKPNLEHCKEAILMKGGTVVLDSRNSTKENQVYRVSLVGMLGGMAMASAIGDHDMIAEGCGTKCLLVRPTIGKKSLEEIPPASTLVIGSDGIWDVYLSEQVGEMVMANRDKQTPLPAAHVIVQRSFCACSEDNLSAIVVHLN